LEHRYSSGHCGHSPILDDNEGACLQTDVFNATWMVENQCLPAGIQIDRKVGTKLTRIKGCRGYKKKVMPKN